MSSTARVANAQQSLSSPLVFSPEVTVLSRQPASSLSADNIDRQARVLYQQGQFWSARLLWQEQAQYYATQQNDLAQASVLSNLCLAYQQLGQWADAELSLSKSLRLLNRQSDDPAKLTVMAQALSASGSLNLAMGSPQTALEDWAQAEAIYDRLGDQQGQTRSQINRAQALRELGFYRQSLALLSDVFDSMALQPDAPFKSTVLLRLGDMLRLGGQLAQSQEVLIRSLTLARHNNQPAEISAALLQLGHLAVQRGDIAAADDFYSRAEMQWTPDMQAASPEQAMTYLVPIELSQLSLKIDQEDWHSASTLWRNLQAHLALLPPSRSRFYHQIHWATSLIRMKQLSQSADVASLTPDWLTLAQSLKEISQQAHRIQDSRAESYALGVLGDVYVATHQWAIAQTLTEQALQLSAALNADEMSYRWQAQLGTVLKSASNPHRSRSQAIEAYTQSIATLSGLRGDLSASNEHAQFSFRSDVEPIYRDLVSLLLEVASEHTDNTGSDALASSASAQQALLQAQGVIESLRLAELDDYFKEACIDVQPININQVDADAAILYTIVLQDRLAVILHLPGQPLQYFSTTVDADNVAQVTQQLRQELVIRSQRRYEPLAQTLYSWLVEPMEDAIAHSGVKTLVFVLDGPLQNVPMAALHNGAHFLIEDYAIALTPGISLLSPQPLQSGDFGVLAAGLTEGRQGLSPLPYVDHEIANIKAMIDDSTVLLNQDFTYQRLLDRVASTRYPLIHIATHGTFGSTPESTYLVAWDQRVNVRDINDLLRANLGSRAATELLVLSACETAAGDHQAALGLAGVAIKAGAKSTVGSLWAINDQSTTQFIDMFYQALLQPGATRASAIRSAQLSMLADKHYRHPIYWAPYVLIGSWL